MRLVGWGSLLLGVAVLGWPVHVEAVRDEALGQGARLIAHLDGADRPRTAATTLAPARPDRYSARALNVAAGVCVGAALAALGAFIVATGAGSRSARRSKLVDIRPMHPLPPRTSIARIIKGAEMASGVVMWIVLVLPLLMLVIGCDALADRTRSARRWYRCMFRHRALSVPDGAGRQICSCGREWSA